MVRRAMSRVRAGPVGCHSQISQGSPVRVLNFYSSVFGDQLRRGRKTATIRLGDKSHKYRKNECVLVTIGYQHSPREKIFNAVIDQVEVKRVRDLSPREIEHDNPEFRRVDEMIHFLEQIYGRKVSKDDTVTVVRFSQIIENPPEQLRDRIHGLGGARNYRTRSARARRFSPRRPARSVRRRRRRPGTRPPRPATVSTTDPARRQKRIAAGQRRRGRFGPRSRRCAARSDRGRTASRRCARPGIGDVERVVGGERVEPREPVSPRPVGLRLDDDQTVVVLGHRQALEPLLQTARTWASGYRERRFAADFLALLTPECQIGLD